MTTSDTRQFKLSSHTLKTCARINLIIFLLTGLSAITSAQTASRPDRGVLPVGSYSVSDIENINLTNGNVNLSIPLAALPPMAGGKLSWVVRAEYNSKLWDRRGTEAFQIPPLSNYTASTLQLSDVGGWRIGGKYSIRVHDIAEDYQGIPPVDSSDPEWSLTGYKWKMIVTTPDGAKHELRPVDYLSYPGSHDYQRGYYKDTPAANSINATMRYYSFDGSYLWAIIDPYPTGGVPQTWTIYLPDGTKVYQMPNNGSQIITDTNGNSNYIYTTVSGTVATTHFNGGYSGRVITYAYNSATNTGQLQYPTIGGSLVSIDVNYGTTSVHGMTYLLGDDCLVEQEVNEQNILVIRSIIFPQTKPGAARLQYTFSYNSDTNDSVSLLRKTACGSNYVTINNPSHGWGSLSRMVTPLGATVDYSYQWDGFHQQNFDPNLAVGESIKQKSVTHDGITDTWDYVINLYGGEVDGPDKSFTSEVMYSHDPFLAAAQGGLDGLAGLVYRTIRGKMSGAQTIPIETIERHWTKLIFSGANDAAPGGRVGFNTIVDAEYRTLHDSNGVAIKMSAKTFQHDYNGNITQTIEYDWFDPSLVSRDSAGIPTGVPGGATVLRITSNNYYNPATSPTSANVYAKRVLSTGAPLILNAMQDTTVGPSQTRYSYDNQAFGVAPTLGNLTKVSRLDNSVNPSQWRDATYGYDSYGNRTSVTDSNNNVTSIVYDSLTNSRPTQITVDPLNGTGLQTTTTVYDYWTGLVTSQTDPNNQTTDTDYTNQLLGTPDPFMRPGVITGPPVTSYVNGVTYTGQRHKTRTTYDDDINVRRVIVESDLNTSGDYKLKTRKTVDRLSRETLVEKNEDGAANYTISAQTVYVIVPYTGTVTLTTNPKRGAAATTDGWTRSTSDALGRVIEVATFLGASQPPSTGTNGNWTGSVTTSYYANQTTVTDQAGKMRRSVTDSLGRLTLVIEDPNGLNYQTSYNYDTLGNLLQVAQGAQRRWFAYDSLSRLIRARNPEQDTYNFTFSPPLPTVTVTVGSESNSDWSVAYIYDANGNLLKKESVTGPSGAPTQLETSYAYDGLNRNTTVSYSDSTPGVTRTYDAATLGKGRLRKTETANGSRMTINAYDAMGRTLSQSQQFYHLGAWGSSYTMQHAYNLVGGVTLQTYPSGHTTTTNYDAAGRVNTFSGNLGAGGTPINYVTGTTVYTPTGQMAQEQFGTTTALYHRRHFTSRGQMYDVRLGTGAADDFSAATWNRGALRTFYSSNLVEYNSPPTGQQNNNGNVYRQDHFAPLNDAASDWVMSVDTYSYDSLNRITGVSEAADSYIGSVFQETFPYTQSFSYDQYGNRVLISATSTATSGAGATTIKDTVWVEDALPAGATAGSDGGDGWTWVSGNPSPVSGSSASQSNVAAGEHQHYFYGATATLPVNTGDKLYAYVYLDPANMPSEVMLQWNENGSWEHRAYWGANNIGWGVDGTASLRNMGALPPNGGWIRLEVAASLVGLEGKTLNGMAFTLYGGRATWDRGGKSAPQTGGSINNLPINVDPARNRLLAVSGTMQYDAAGNLSHDNYTTPLLGQRNYDAENRMKAVYNNSGVLQDSYYYDGDGRRARRVIVGVETWQIYGIGGELVAEYAAGGATNAPQKEYGYRGGQSLITAESDGTVKWLVADQLGTPRMVVNKSGALGGASGIVRHDYAPFGEELGAGVGIRSAALGYGDDLVRQKFTSKERDSETGLDYFLARYYSSAQGRFTSPDEFTGGPDELYDFADNASDNPTFYADLTNPQSLNKYQYTYNNPLRYTDSDGHCPLCPVVEEVLESPAGQQIIQKATPYVVAGAAAIAAYASGAFDYVKNGLKKIQANADSSYVCGDFLECGNIQQFKKEAASQAQAQPSTQNQPQAMAKPEAKPEAKPQPTEAGRGHRKGARKSTHDKHTKPRPGDKQPPNYIPFRDPPKKPPKPAPTPMPNKGPKKKPNDDA